MKTKDILRSARAPFVALGLLTAGSASGQTITQFFSNAGSGSNAAAGGVTSTGTLSSIGFDMSTYNEFSGQTLNDNGGVSTRPANGAVRALSQNFTSSLVTPAGYELSSVTVYIFAESINPDGSLTSFTLNDSLNGTGNVIQTLDLLGGAGGQEGTFLALTLTAQQYLGGFSISSPGLGATALFNASSELSTTNGGFQTPGLSATFTAIPEPSAVLLGAIGSLALLRRRRA